MAKLLTYDGQVIDPTAYIYMYVCMWYLQGLCVNFWVFQGQPAKTAYFTVFEAASNVWDGTSQAHKILVFTVFTVGSCKVPRK